MKTKTQILTIMMMTSISLFAFGEDRNREERRAAFQACVTETGVTKPERGSRPNEEDRQKIKTCMEGKGFSPWEGRGKKSAKRKAFKECAEENNLQRPESGVRPSNEDRAKMDACLASKGITMNREPSAALSKW